MHDVCITTTSLTAGTVLHRTRTPLLVWFWAIFLIFVMSGDIRLFAFLSELGVTLWVSGLCSKIFLRYGQAGWSIQTSWCC